MKRQKEQPLIKKVSVNFLGLKFDAEGLPLAGLYALLATILAVIVLLICF